MYVSSVAELWNLELIDVSADAETSFSGSIKPADSSSKFRLADRTVAIAVGVVDA